MVASKDVPLEFPKIKDLETGESSGRPNIRVIT